MINNVQATQAKQVKQASNDSNSWTNGADHFSIHTSDRIAFKRCRRKWDFSSPLRKNLAPQSGAITPLWFGTGFHFALEDFHGLRLWPTAADAFAAYAQACSTDEKPANVEELLQLATGMFDHYDLWLAGRDEFELAIFKESDSAEAIQRPAAEVNFSIHLVDLDGYFNLPVFYEGTLDGIYSHRSTGNFWIAEYKTAKVFDVQKLLTDDQVGAYLWSLSRCLPQSVIEGIVYKQFKKSVPNKITPLKTGELSVNKQQRTTYAEYRKALQELHPGVPINELPNKYQEMLMYLSMQETPEGDDFINQQLVKRSPANILSQGRKINLDAFEMLNDPAITTNPTRDCTWDCPFRDVCIAMDEGADWQGLLDLSFAPKCEATEQWQQRLHIPDSIHARAANLVGKTWFEYKEERRLILDGSSR